MSPDQIQSIVEMSQNPRNVVFIISRASKSELEHSVWSAQRQIGLISDHGYYFRTPGKHGHHPSWECLLSSSMRKINTTWQHIAMKIIETYVERTNGSFVIQNEVSIIYNFEKADPDFGTCLGHKCFYTC